MLKTIKLTNFRQHRDLTVTLTPGLNVMRGANEAGKSTIMEAAAYAFYGSTMLEESLEETVTWTEPVNTLRVEVTFSFDGLEGVVKRGKSGAEAMYGTQLVSGQAAVTEFFEALFRTPKQRVRQLQFAMQGKLRGATEDSSAVELIESLGDFTQLDDLIDRIQANRPTGSTKLLQDRILRLTEEVDTPVPDEPSLGAVEAATLALAEAEQSLAPLAELADEAALRLVEAREVLTLAAKQEALLKGRNARMQELRELTAVTPVQPAVSLEDIDSYRKALAAEADEDRLRKLRNKPVPACQYGWDESREAFMTAVAAAIVNQTKLSKERSELNVAKVQKQALRINEKTCAFCKLDLTDVPEVVRRNSEVDAEVAAMEAKLAELDTQLAELAASTKAYNAILAVDNDIQKQFASEPWTLVLSTVPATPVWTGPEFGPVGDRFDNKGMIAKGEAAWAAYSRDMGRYNSQKADLEALQSQPEPVVPDVKVAKLTIESSEATIALRRVAEGQVSDAKAGLKLAKVGYEHAVEMRNAEIKALDKKKAELKQAKDELKTTEFFNGLVKKIQQARPAVANELWSLVLSAVSHYATQGRGVPTAVTREGKSFKLNGRPLSSYSGSAKDVVGLAVRIALIKTFMPNMPFATMDEIASACDDARELTMLGMLIEADIPQVLLVTHSDAAESFAANLIVLG